MERMTFNGNQLRDIFCRANTWQKRCSYYNVSASAIESAEELLRRPPFEDSARD